MMNDTLCGLGAVATSYVLAETTGFDGILISILTAVAYGLVNLGIRVLTSWLERKGLLSNEDKKKIDMTVEDLSDDGKINGSNKK